MESNSTSTGKKSAFSKSLIGVIIVLILAGAGYFIYKNVGSVQPDYNKYLDFINEGDSLVKGNKFPEAKKSYEKSLKYNPKDEAAAKKIVKLDSATQLIKKQNFEAAKKMFEVVVKLPASSSLSPYALSKAGVTDNPPIKISIKWKGQTLIITISGGVPFNNENQPYTIEGIGCINCVQWTKDTANKNNYIANVTGTKIKANRLKLKDKLGQFSYGDVPRQDMYEAAPEAGAKNKINTLKPTDKVFDAQTFASYVKSGDSLFQSAKYSEAKNEYISALSTHPGDKNVNRKILACDEKINEINLSAAKNIPRVQISGGSFAMGTNNGNPEDGPEHNVSIRSFSLGKTEVTVAQYRNFCSATGRAMPSPPPYGWADNNPMVNVTWDEAKVFCNWVGGRLPTEAEWEYAARGGVKTTYSGSNLIDRVAIYKANSGNKPGAVGRKGSNNYNLSDMTGNVSEWCADWYGRNQYAQGDANNPKGPTDGDEKVLRGGAYNSDINSTQDGNQLKVTYRNSESPSTRRASLGSEWHGAINGKSNMKCQT